jgi:CHAT domain-containing protein
MSIKRIFIVQLLILICIHARAKNKENGFEEKIVAIVNSSVGDTEKLSQLLNIQLQMKKLQLVYDSSYVLLLQKTGFIYYKLSDYKSAIALTNEAIIISKNYRSYCYDTPLSLVYSYSNLYYYYENIADMKNIDNAFDSCIFYASKFNVGFEMVIPILSDKIENLFNQGKYHLCENVAEMGRGIVTKFYKNHLTKHLAPYMVSFVNKKANALYFSKNFNAASKLVTEKIAEFNAAGFNKLTGPFYISLGLIEQDKKNYIEALSLLREGYKKNLQIKYQTGCAESLTYQAILNSRYFKEYKKALYECNKALSFGDASDSTMIYREIGNVYRLQNSSDSAQVYYQLAFNTIQKGMDEKTLQEKTFLFPSTNILQKLSDLVTDKADAYQQQYLFSKDKNYLISAINVYKKNDLFLEKIKTDQQLDLASNLVWKTTARNLYEHAIEACYLGHNTEDAFYFFEKSRAVLLNDQLNELRSLNNADIAELAALKKSVTVLDKKLTTIPFSSDEYLSVSNDLYFKNEQLEKLADSIKNRNAAYRKTSTDTSFITVGQLQKKLLRNSQALMEVFCGDSSVYVLSVTDNNRSLVKINKQLYDSVSNYFISLIYNPSGLNNHYKDFIKTSHQLYTLLFQQMPSSYSSIIISPDGKGYPFEALVTNDNEQEPDYFLNRHATSYTYSAKYLLNQFTANTNSSNNIMGVAPVQYTNNQNLAELSGSDESLKTINTYFSKAKNFIFNSATKRNFLQNFPDYTIIQLYAHASDSSSYNDPVIYFSDSALYLSSLIPDRKAVVTQLVVLSACETANGKLYEGEGIFSFNRGFAALGIPAAISSLWSVNNKSTYKITELFYKYLSQGLPMDVALQKAKLEFIKTATLQENKLPYYWAGVILTGKVAVIKSGNSFHWGTILALTFLFLLIIYFTIKIFVKKTEFNYSKI